MKKIILIITLIVLTELLLNSCKKDDKSNSSNNLSKTLEQGNWLINLYIDNGKNETSDFSSFTFTFKNGNVNAINQINTFTGTYTESRDDNHEKLTLNFGAVLPLIELNDDWHVLNKSDSQISLEDKSGGNGGTDMLTFVKK